MKRPIQNPFRTINLSKSQCYLLNSLETLSLHPFLRPSPGGPVFTVGDAVEYFGASQNRWISATVVALLPSGNYNLDVKQAALLFFSLGLLFFCLFFFLFRFVWFVGFLFVWVFIFFVWVLALLVWRKVKGMAAQGRPKSCLNSWFC